jgi:plasmid stabilization system protein ParE
LEVRRKAAEDTAEAAVWYEQRSQGLGAEFIRAIDACLALIARNPLAFPVVYREARMALPRRFPYKIIYRARAEAVIVVAVMHGHRHPNRWQKRVD